MRQLLVLACAVAWASLLPHAAGELSTARTGTVEITGSEFQKLRREVESLKREIHQMRRHEQEVAHRGHRPATAPPLKRPPVPDVPLPPVPDFAGFGEGVVWNKTAAFNLVAPPHPLLPDKKMLKEDGEEEEQRFRYFCSFSFILVATFFVLGSVALQVRNGLLRAPLPGWARLRSISATELRRRSREGQDIILLLNKRGWMLPSAVVFIYVITGCMVWFCYVHGAVSAEYGIDWEFWVAWVFLGCVLGLAEVCLLAGRPGRRDPTLYITAMVMSHLPLLSERMDMTKDIIFIAIAAQHVTWIAFLAAILLLGSHIYFLSNGTIQAELLAAYFPVLLSTPAEEEECEGDEERGEGHRREWCGCGRCWRDVLAAMAGRAASEVLKQTSPARSQIAMWEDLPQAVLMLVFTVLHEGAGTFVLISLLLSVLRVLLSREGCSGPLRRCLRDHLEKERTVAVRSGNPYRALAITQTIWSVDPDYRTPELRTLGIPASTLREYGCSVGQLQSAGFELIEIKTASYEVAELKEAGYDAASLKAVGFAAAELLGAGFSPAELKSAAFSPAELKAVGCSARALKALNFTAAELRATNFALGSLMGAGFTAAELKIANFTAAELRAERCTAAELKAAGFALGELKRVGFSLAELKAAGFAPGELKRLGFRPAELKSAGYTAAELKAVDCSARELRQVGFTAAELRAACGFSPAELKSAGYTVAELTAVGCSARELKALDFTAAELRAANFALESLMGAGFTAAELKSANFTAADLAAERCAAAELKAAGFALAELKRVGFRPAELKTAGYTAVELKAVDCSARELRAAGFTAAELRGAYTAAELKAAGFALAQLQRVGISPAELASAGYTLAELNAVDCSAH